MALINTHSFTELTGTTWDAAAESNKRTKTLTGNTEITITNAPANFEGLLEVTNSGYTLTINGAPVTIKPIDETMIGILSVGGVLKFYSSANSGNNGGGTVQLEAPVLSASVASASQINLSWADVEHESSYQLQRATNSSFTANLVTLATPAAGITSYNDTGLQKSITYYYRIKAVGNGTSITDSSYGTTSATISSSGTAQLSTPSLSASVVSDTQINLSWNDVENESSYQLQRATDILFTANLITLTTPAAGTTSYNDTSLSAGTTYFFRIKAVGNGTTYVDSGYGSAQATTTGVGNQLPMPTPTITSNSDTSQTISWNAVSEATSYTLKANSVDDYAGAGTIYAGSGTSYVFSGRDPGTTYFYWLIASGAGKDDSVPGTVSAMTTFSGILSANFNGLLGAAPVAESGDFTEVINMIVDGAGNAKPAVTGNAWLLWDGANNAKTEMIFATVPTSGAGSVRIYHRTNDDRSIAITYQLSRSEIGTWNMSIYQEDPALTNGFTTLLNQTVSAPTAFKRLVAETTATQLKFSILNSNGTVSVSHTVNHSIATMGSPITRVLMTHTDLSILKLTDI